MDPTENDVEAEPGFVKKILSIRCMRNSLLYGISGGLGIGLSHFLLTSNVSRAVYFAFGGYCVIMYGTWGVCRYQTSKETYNALQWQKAQQSKSTNIKLLDPKDV